MKKKYKNFKILKEFTVDIEQLKKDFEKVATILKNNQDTDVYSHGFVSINKVPGEDRPLYKADIRAAHWIPSENDEEKYRDGLELKYEENYSEFYPEFKNTYTEEVCSLLSKKFKLGRIRYSIRLPRSCLSWHRDIAKRIHIPITTNPGCQFVIEDEVYHMPANGNVYLADTLNYHNFFNGGETNRIHFIAVVL
jgi:hypothetical protein